MYKKLVFLGVLVLIVGSGLYFALKAEAPVVVPVAETPSEEVLGQTRAVFMCNEGKVVDAVFTEGEKIEVPAGMPPVPAGKVTLVLNGEDTKELKQTISASGVRYANEDESFVFWNKGNKATILEDDIEKTYTNCVFIAPAAEEARLPRAYASTDGSFSVRLPSLAQADVDGYAVDEAFKNQLTPKKSISGVKFTIPSSLSRGKNLSSDTYISVENIPNTDICSAELFFDGEHTAIEVIEGGVTYSVASSSNAGAGNRYEETVYALPGTNPCMAVRYMVHYTVFQNYDPGTVEEFKIGELIAQFDSIRKTLVVNQ